MTVLRSIGRRAPWTGISAPAYASAPRWLAVGRRGRPRRRRLGGLGRRLVRGRMWVWAAASTLHPNSWSNQGSHSLRRPAPWLSMRNRRPISTTLSTVCLPRRRISVACSASAAAVLVVAACSDRRDGAGDRGGRSKRHLTSPLLRATTDASHSRSLKPFGWGFGNGVFGTSFPMCGSRRRRFPSIVDSVLVPSIARLSFIGFGNFPVVQSRQRCGRLYLIPRSRRSS